MVKLTSTDLSHLHREISSQKYLIWRTCSWDASDVWSELAKVVFLPAASWGHRSMGAGALWLPPNVPLSVFPSPCSVVSGALPPAHMYPLSLFAVSCACGLAEVLWGLTLRRVFGLLFQPKKFLIFIKYWIIFFLRSHVTFCEISELLTTLLKKIKHQLSLA